MFLDFVEPGFNAINRIDGVYDMKLVVLSYIVATIASYIALDITGRLRDAGNSFLITTLWLIGGAVAMGAGIWSMHFIGMLAFRMPMNMSYDPLLTLISLIVAILASSFALILLKNKDIKILRLAFGGIILGLAIASMHYIGMAAMRGHMEIHYIISIFCLSIVIAIVASEVAIWLALKSNNQTHLKNRIRLKIVSALIMGAAICGMHYTGMAAAIFTVNDTAVHEINSIDPQFLSIIVAMVTLFILTIAFAASAYKEMLNYQVVKFARQAGMAEVASNVLHNIGNVLNTVNISSSVMAKRFLASKLSGLTDLSRLLEEHKKDLSSYVDNEHNRENLVNYIKVLSEYWQNEKTFFVNEISTLDHSIEHIKKIIEQQQVLSGASNVEKLFTLEKSIDEALDLMNVKSQKYNILIKKEFGNVDKILHDKTKLMQVLINLIQNAKDSLLEAGAKNKCLIIKTGMTDSKSIYIKFIDNGLGIPKDNLIKIFSHGFTTKKSGHGFGLHASALACNEMGGNLQAESEGLGQGATFTINLPYKK